MKLFTTRRSMANTLGQDGKVCLFKPTARLLVGVLSGCMFASVGVEAETKLSATGIVYTPFLADGIEPPEPVRQTVGGKLTYNLSANNASHPSAQGVSYNVSSTSVAGYGSVGVRTQVSLSGNTGSGERARAYADAQAGFTDELTIDIPGRNGETVEIVVRGALSGNLGATGDLDANNVWAGVMFTAQVNGSTPVFITRSTRDQDEQDRQVGDPIEIVLGEPFPVKGRLIANTSIDWDDLPWFTDVSADAFAAYGNTAYLTGMDVFDSSGNLISPDTYELTSASGQFAFVVPEPSTLALLGLGGLMVTRRRRG